MGFHWCANRIPNAQSHPYPAKFIPQIPNALIQELSAVGDTVADVFCGSGTTLVEAVQLKRHAVGIDANPLATAISRAKTTTLEESEFRELGDLRDCCQRVVAMIDPGVNDLFHQGMPFKSSAWRPANNLCDFWFEPHVVEELAEIRHMIDRIPADAPRNLASVAFAAIVVSVSKQDSDTRYVRRNKVVEPGDTVRRYVSQLDAAMTAVGDPPEVTTQLRSEATSVRTRPEPADTSADGPPPALGFRRYPRRRCLRYATHGLHEYRGKFFPQLVRALINISGVPESGIVVDPMAFPGRISCSAGTTFDSAS